MRVSSLTLLALAAGFTLMLGGCAQNGDDGADGAAGKDGADVGTPANNGTTLGSNGRTLTPAYATNVRGNGGYVLNPLLTTGDQIPLLTGSWGTNGNGYTPSTTQSFAFSGIPDGLGIWTDPSGNYWVWVNHEFNRGVKSDFAKGWTGQFSGSRVSLFKFDKNWKVIGGTNAITQVVNGAGAVYATITADSVAKTLTYTNKDTANFGDFGRFCSGYLETDTTLFPGGPYWIAPEEGGGKDRLWIVDTKGTATSFDGVGLFRKENGVAAHNYSGKTVFMVTEDDSDGEMYMWVGTRTATDPLGINTGDLYMAKIFNGATAAADESDLPKGTVATLKWVKVPATADLTGVPAGITIAGTVTAANLKTSTVNLAVYANGLDAAAAGVSRSTNFTRIEDIAEDQNTKGTFYFNTTGNDFNAVAERWQDASNGGIPWPNKGTNPFGGNGSGTTLTGTGTNPNPYGRTYKLVLNGSDPIGDGTIVALADGGLGSFDSVDNITVDDNGGVWMMEDLNGGLPTTAMAAETRNNSIWRMARDGSGLKRIFELDQQTFDTSTATVKPSVIGSGSGQATPWESSGIVYLPGGSNFLNSGRSAVMFDVQAHSLTGATTLNGAHVEGGQLIIAWPAPVGFADLTKASTNLGLITGH